MCHEIRAPHRQVRETRAFLWAIDDVLAHWSPGYFSHYDLAVRFEKNTFTKCHEHDRMTDEVLSPTHEPGLCTEPKESAYSPAQEISRADGTVVWSAFSCVAPKVDHPTTSRHFVIRIHQCLVFLSVVAVVIIFER
jgi:hypothetical protein